MYYVIFHTILNANKILIGNTQMNKKTCKILQILIGKVKKVKQSFSSTKLGSHMKEIILILFPLLTVLPGTFPVQYPMTSFWVNFSELTYRL